MLSAFRQNDETATRLARATHSQRYTNRERQTDKQTGRPYTCMQTGEQTVRSSTCIQTDPATNRQADRQALHVNIQTDQQTSKQSFMHRQTNM